MSETVERLERDVPALLDETRVPCVSIAVIADAKLAWAGVFEREAHGRYAPATINTVFEAASISKPVFAYLALLLCQDGLLDLDTPLCRYVTEPLPTDDPLADSVTARHVLSHTTGFPNWRTPARPLKCYFRPGIRFSYSGEGYVYLQRAVEAVTGMGLQDLAERRLFSPAGMNRSSYVWPAPDGRVGIERYFDNSGNAVAKKPSPSANAAHSLHSTPSDIARFMCAVMSPRHASRGLLSAAWMDRMLTPQVHVSDLNSSDADWPDPAAPVDPKLSWGLGWGIEHTDHGDNFWQWGSDGTVKALAVGCAQRGSGMVIMTNHGAGASVWRPLLGMAFEGPHPGLDWLDRVY